MIMIIQKMMLNQQKNQSKSKIFHLNVKKICKQDILILKKKQKFMKKLIEYFLILRCNHHFHKKNILKIIILQIKIKIINNILFKKCYNQSIMYYIKNNMKKIKYKLKKNILIVIIILKNKSLNLFNIQTIFKKNNN